MAFGEVIATRRKALDFSQKELAARIRKEDGTPISPQYLNDLERDRRNAPSQHLLKEFARELQLPVGYLSYLAGEIPEELRGRTSEPDQVQGAWIAFRRRLEGSE